MRPRSSGRNFSSKGRRPGGEEGRRPSGRPGRSGDERKSSFKRGPSKSSDRRERPTFGKSSERSGDERRRPSFRRDSGTPGDERRRPSFSRESGRGEERRKPAFGRGPSGDRRRPSFGRDSDRAGDERGKPSFDRGPGRPKEERKRSSFYGKPFGPSSSRTRKPRGASDDRKTGFVQARLSRQRNYFKENSSEETKTPSDEIRLNRFISNSGICSRREADNLIQMGLVSVNGKTVTELGVKVKRTDDVRYEGKRLTAEKPVYILLNKPKGFITTTEDPQERNTVMNLIAGACKERVYPVGRLDRNTTGLLLFTNDGELADRLTHPSFNVRKIYKVELDKPITKSDFDKIKEGVRLEEGRAMVDDLAIVDDDKKTIGIELHIGWNRIVRRIFEALGYQVTRLDRVVYAGLDKKDLPRGKWRFLKDTEVVRLKHFNKKDT